MERHHSLGLGGHRGSLAVVFVFAFVLGAFASAGLVAERLTRGNTALAIALVLGGLALVLLTLGVVRPFARRVGPFLAAQGLGALLGVLASHLALALIFNLVPRPDGLSETPAQLVNDTVLVLGLGALVGSVALRARRARGLLAVAAFALVALYQATALEWHVDAFSFGELTIQRFVAMQVLAVAAGLLAFDWIAAGARR